MESVKSLTILAIDDDPGDLVILRRLLKRITDWSITLRPHCDIRAGLADLERLPFDLVILDYDMGTETGLDVFRRIRSKNVSLPVILWTGRADSETEERARKAGVSDYLFKNTVDMERLRASIGGVLGR